MWINSLIHKMACEQHIIKKIKASQKMTTRQSESNHASIYMSNGLYFCPELARNDNFAPIESLNESLFASVKIKCTCVQMLHVN